MKKVFLMLSVLLVGLTAFADEDRPITQEQLPAKAKEFLKQHFPDSTIALVTEERDFTKVTYEVFFTNGNKVEFDKQGHWKEVECNYSKVPQAIIPQKIQEYIARHYPGRLVKELSRSRRDYEVKLEHGLELKFDLRFNLIEIDD